jgi:CHAT domain-containing protein
MDPERDPREAARDLREAGQNLRRSVWEKLTPHLGDAKTVLISPDGPLCRFPFAALPGKTEGTYLVEEDFLLVNVPVPQMLPGVFEIHEKVPADPKLLLVGDVDYRADPGSPSQAEAAASTDGRAGPENDRAVPAISRSAPRGDANRKWPALPGTDEEVKSVAKLYKQAFPKGEARWLLRGQSTEQQFRTHSEGQQFLHLATHGYFDEARLARAAQIAQVHRQRGLFGAEQEVVGFHPDLLCALRPGARRRKPTGQRRARRRHPHRYGSWRPRFAADRTRGPFGL